MLRSPRVISLLGALLLGAQLGLAALWSSGIDRTVIGVLAALLGVGALLSIPAVRGRLPRTRWLMLALALILVMCGAPQASQLLPMEPGILASRVAPPAAVVPAYTAHMARVQESLKQEIPIVMLSEGLDDAQRTAQDLAVHDSRVLSKLRAKTGEPLRNEVFAVRPVRQSDITDETAVCRSGRCLRVEIYHYADNSATVAMVDVATRAVVAVADLPQMQPDIPKDLEQAAIEIAVSAPEVEQALGSKPNAGQATMAEMKTSLNNTRCERSQHLCVAPTFLVGEKALWAIVDLTDGVLVGVQWTNLGASQTPKITEKTIQDSAIMAQLCDQVPSIDRDGWKLNYMLTSSDGLRVADVHFRDQLVLHSAKLVDWHVSYSGKQAFGYSDAVGCPLFSTAAVPAYEPPTISDLRDGNQVIGFAIDQEFRHPSWPTPCSYNYHSRYEFYRDGRFRVVAASWGRGCGNEGTYRPVMRIDLAGDQNRVAAWDGTSWKPWTTEQWMLQTDTTAYTPDGYLFRVLDGAGQGFFIAPGHGQYTLPPKNDHAYIYVTKHHEHEGDADMITIGPCCNTNEQQGPEKFIGAAPEGIDGAHLVLWYTPQLKNSDTPGQEACWADSHITSSGVYAPKVWACEAGPMFVPTRGGQ